MQTQEPGALVTTTVKDYDLAETSKLVSYLLEPQRSQPSPFPTDP